MAYNANNGTSSHRELKELLTARKMLGLMREERKGE